MSAIPDDDDFVMTAGYNPRHSRTVIDPDTRVIIDDTSEFPYAAVAFLNIKHECGCYSVGTGFMVSANCMLTAAHCLVCADHPTSAISKVNAKFGYESTTSCLIEAVATPSDATFYIDPSYTGSEANYDCGYVVFGTNVGNTTGWFGLASRSDSALTNTAVSVSGYIRTTFYHGTGTIKGVTPYRVKYDTDTDGGQSGSPVYFYGSTYGYQAVAIHTHGTSDSEPYNSGWRITSSFINMLDTLGYVDKVE